MKKRNKIVLSAIGMISVIVATSLGTIAYFTDSDSVTNTFTVGSVEITLDEADVNEAGQPLGKDEKVVEKVEDAARVDSNKYHLIPGHTYVKDPTVTVLKGSEESYIRMLVTINEQNDLNEIFKPDGIELETIFNGFDESSWTCVSETKKDDTRTYEFYYKETVAAPDGDVKLPPLFTSITVPGEITKEDLAKIKDLKIDVEAHAIQAEGFDTADEAWDAIDK